MKKIAITFSLAILTLALLGHLGGWISVASTPPSEEAPAPASVEEPPIPILPPMVSWREHPVWNDGLVELSRYSATRTIYGKERPYVALHLVNAQDLDRRTWVKAATETPASERLRIFKFNTVEDIQTDFYTYHYLTTCFLDAGTLAPVEYRLGCEEWCGTTFKEWRNEGVNSHFLTFSYQIAEGRQDDKVRVPEDAVLYEALPVWLRSFEAKEGKPVSLSLSTDQVLNHYLAPGFEPATVTAGGKETVACGLGSVETVKVYVKTKGFTETFWFEAPFPNSMIKRVDKEGDTFLLQTRERIKYWH